jgi:hypothetical protein
MLRAMSRPRELPMAPAGCTLDDRGLAEQLHRYRRLGETAASIQDYDARLVITFAANVDVNLLRETIAIESRCCSFFALDYEPSARRLSIGIDDPARGDALRAVLSSLRAAAPASTR